jgi:ATP-dependent RNA helicase RhlB
MNFSEFNLNPELQKGIAEAGYTACMPVQEQVLQKAFSGADLYVQSQTGTGKTAAFLIVIFQRLLSEPALKGKRALIMAPTRELAVQTEEEAKKLGKYLPIKAASFYGGVGYGDQTRALRNNVEVMVGTPGRVLDLNSSGQMNLMNIAFLVLDEADRMFDMGFYPDLRKLIKVVPPADRRQTMLFSATLNNYVKNLAWEYTKSPVEIEIKPEEVTVKEIEQKLYHVSSADKFRLLLGILKREQPESALVFCNTKHYTEIVAKRLRLNGIDCEFIMGDLPQVKRLHIIDDLKAGRIHFLVATDVAARGLDIDDLAMVVNYDLPNEAENYVHRIGRTARAGKTGKAMSLASEEDVYELPAIERFINQKIPSVIAAPEDYAEDKSEGVRIRTDDYEEGGRERHGGRGSRSDAGGRRSGSTAGGRGRSREKQEKFAGRKGRPEGRNSGQAASAASPEQARQSTGNAAETQRLSAMSSEQRMAYYKQKYGKGAAAKPGSGRPGSPGTKQQPASRQQRPKRKGQKQQKPRNQSAAQQRQAKPSVSQRPAVSAPKKPGLQGVLSRITSLFHKKQGS